VEGFEVVEGAGEYEGSLEGAIIAMVRRRAVGSPRPCRTKRTAPREIQSVKMSAVACRRWSLVLATSRAMVAIGQASA
jgi:hypothetical protein